MRILRSGAPGGIVVIKITASYLPPSRLSGAMSAPLTPISAPGHLQPPRTR